MPKELFRFDSNRSVEAWSSIDDAVMGGMSVSHLRFEEAGFAVFEGVVSLENNGGFASVRSRPTDLGAAAVRHYALGVRGDGRRYKLNLRTDDSGEVNYQASFAPPAGIWTLQRLAPEEFLPTMRGRIVSGAPALDPAKLRQVGLMIGDRQAGNFSLSLRFIRAE